MSEEICTPGEAYEMINDLGEHLRTKHADAHAEMLAAPGAGGINYYAGYRDGIRYVLDWLYAPGVL